MRIFRRLFNNFSRKSPAEIVLHCFVSLIFAAVAVSYVYIIIWAIIASMKTHTEVVMNPFGLPSEWQWQNLVNVTSLLEVNGHDFWEMLFNSCVFSVIPAFITQFTTVTFAYACTKYKFPGSEWPYAIILIMMTLPIYGAGGAAYKLFRDLGMIDSYTYILSAAGGMSMNFLYYRAFFKNMSWAYAEAAQVDGAGHFGIYFKVMLPQAKPIFGALYLLNWLSSWNDYSSALLYFPNLPTLPVGIYQFNQEMIYRARLDILFAACVLVSVPALVLFVAFNKIITTNISLGGIKG